MSRILKHEYLENGEILRKKFTIKYCYTGLYLPLNETIVNVVLRNLDLNFQGHKFEPLTYIGNDEIYRKNASYDFHIG